MHVYVFCLYLCDGEDLLIYKTGRKDEQLINRNQHLAVHHLLMLLLCFADCREIFAWLFIHRYWVLIFELKKETYWPFYTYPLQKCIFHFSQPLNIHSIHIAMNNNFNVFARIECLPDTFSNIDCIVSVLSGI